MTNIIKNLSLFENKKNAHNLDSTNVLFGVDAKELYATTKQHSVYRQAIDALVENIFMHPLVYSKNKKYAEGKLTPQWATTICYEIIDSFWAVGYAAIKFVNNRVIVGIPTEFDLEYNVKHGKWELKYNGMAKQTSTWQLVMWLAPVRYTNTSSFNSAAKRAEKDTAIYNQLHRNHRQKDYFNSNPSVFTTVDKNLKNVNGSSKQWFQSATASTAAATRTTPVDSNFKYLVNQRADSIRQLADATGLFRNSHKPTKLAGEDTETLEDSTNKQHIEHVVTDGRDIQPSRVLMSLTDGHQILLDAENKIFFHCGVPPQIKGRNINAERSGINPRLNEIALSQFFNLVSRLRTLLGTIFSDKSLVVAGSSLTFQPCLSPYELDKLQPILKTSILPHLYACAYHVPETFFDITKLETPDIDSKTTADNFKRKRADDTEDHSASTPEQAKKQKRAAEKHGVR